MLELIQLDHRELLLERASPLLLYGEEILLLYMSISTGIVCLFVDYLVMASGLPWLVFSVVLGQGSGSLALVAVLLLKVLVVVLGLPTVASRERVHGIVVEDDMGSVTLRSFRTCRGLLLDHG